MSFYLFDSKKENFSNFIYESLIDLSYTTNFKFDANAYNEKSFTKITNPKFDNILLIENQEVLIKVSEENPRYYEFKFSKVEDSFAINLGVELETCFELDCTGKNLPKPILEKLNFVNNTKETKNKKFQWMELVIYHLQNNIIPFLSAEFLRKFSYAFVVPIKDSKTGLYFDMKTGNTISNSRKIDDYKTLIFIPDSSIKCNKNGSTGYRLPCEIVTPVLNSVKDLDLLLNGLTNANCNLSNETTGYHVNVSLVNSKNKIIPITRGLGVTLLKNWLKYEEKHYFSLRGDSNRYAKNLKQKLESDNLQKLIAMTISRKNGDMITKEDFDAPYGLKYWYGSHLLNHEKYISMTNHKKNNVIEFRVFPSKNDVNTLLKYTQDAIDVMSQSAKEYSFNFENIILGLQSNYIKFKYLPREPFDVFGGHFEEFNYVGRYLMDYITAYTKVGNTFEYVNPDQEENYTIIFDYKGKLYTYKVNNNPEADYFTLTNKRRMSEEAFDKLIQKINQ